MQSLSSIASKKSASSHAGKVPRMQACSVDSTCWSSLRSRCPSWRTRRRPPTARRSPDLLAQAQQLPRRRAARDRDADARFQARRSGGGAVRAGRRAATSVRTRSRSCGWCGRSPSPIRSTRRACRPGLSRKPALARGLARSGQDRSAFGIEVRASWRRRASCSRHAAVRGGDACVRAEARCLSSSPSGAPIASTNAPGRCLLWGNSAETAMAPGRLDDAIRPLRACARSIELR